MGRRKAGTGPRRDATKPAHPAANSSLNLLASYYDEEGSPARVTDAPGSPVSLPVPDVESCDLPAGWVEITDSSSNCPYFWNQATGETTWDQPKATAPAEEEGNGQVPTGPAKRARCEEPEPVHDTATALASEAAFTPDELGWDLTVTEAERLRAVDAMVADLWPAVKQSLRQNGSHDPSLIAWETRIADWRDGGLSDAFFVRRLRELAARVDPPSAELVEAKEDGKAEKTATTSVVAAATPAAEAAAETPVTEIEAEELEEGEVVSKSTDKPTSEVGAVDAQPEPAPIPAGFTATWDEGRRAFFYTELDTGVSSWTPPAVATQTVYEGAATTAPSAPSSTDKLIASSLLLFSSLGTTPSSKEIASFFEKCGTRYVRKLSETYHMVTFESPKMTIQALRGVATAPGLAAVESLAVSSWVDASLAGEGVFVRFLQPDDLQQPLFNLPAEEFTTEAVVRKAPTTVVAKPAAAATASTHYPATVATTAVAVVTSKSSTVISAASTVPATAAAAASSAHPGAHARRPRSRPFSRGAWVRVDFRHGPKATRSQTMRCTATSGWLARLPSKSSQRQVPWTKWCKREWARGRLVSCGVI